MAEETPVGPNYGGGIILAAGVLMILAAIGLIIAHLYMWLRFGAWPEYTAPQLFADIGIPYPTVSWVGVQKALDFLMRWSASTLLFWSGFGVAWLGGGMLEARDRRDSAARSAKLAREAEARRVESEARRRD
jgi:hypothetical protein